MASLRTASSSVLEGNFATEAGFSGRGSFANGAQAPSSGQTSSARQQRRHSTLLIDPLSQHHRNLHSLGSLHFCNFRARRLRTLDRCPPQQAAAGDEPSGSSVPLGVFTPRDSTHTALKAAAQRLESLLSRVGDGEEELVHSILSEEEPGLKLAADILGCCCVALTCWAFCAFCHIDPLGGASFSMASLRAAGLGAAVALPQVLASFVARSPGARCIVPELEDVWQEQVRDLKPAVSNMTAQQAQLFAASETVASLLLLLPMATGGLQLSFHLYFNHLEAMGYHVPMMVPQIMALGLMAFGMYANTRIAYYASEEEIEVVRTAVSNSDRYYTLLNGKAEGRIKQAAFTEVAATWMRRRKVASQIAAQWEAHRWVLLGFLWFLTGDLACPMASALVVNAFEIHYVHQAILLRQPWTE